MVAVRKEVPELVTGAEPLADDEAEADPKAAPEAAPEADGAGEAAWAAGAPSAMSAATPAAGRVVESTPRIVSSPARQRSANVRSSPRAGR
ncbi:hypothetical protein GCM10010442_20230 [Kitasatospora kifunensis]